jgi:hypothetical protein
MIALEEVYGRFPYGQQQLAEEVSQPGKGFPESS